MITPNTTFPPIIPPSRPPVPAQQWYGDIEEKKPQSTQFDSHAKRFRALFKIYTTSCVICFLAYCFVSFGKPYTETPFIPILLATLYFAFGGFLMLVLIFFHFLALSSNFYPSAMGFELIFFPVLSFIMTCLLFAGLAINATHFRFILLSTRMVSWIISGFVFILFLYKALA